MNSNNGGTDKDNVIDLTERIQTPDYRERLKNLKVRFDLEQAKIAVSTSLLSIVVLVTMANRNMMTVDASDLVDSHASRAIASIPTGTSDAEDQFVEQLSHHSLKSAEGMGHKSSALESLAFGTLEGKYAVRLLNGKLSALEFSNRPSAGSGDEPNVIAQEPTRVGDLSSFLESNRDLLPAGFTRSVKIGRSDNGDSVTEVYQLVDQVSRPVAKVQFAIDAAGRMLAMHVVPTQIASR